jgi:hypothetical protein
MNKRLLAHWNSKALARLASVLPNDAFASSKSWRAYLPHARRVLKQTAIEKYDDTSMLLLGRFGGCLYVDGRYAEAEASSVQVVETSISLLGQDHP